MKEYIGVLIVGNFYTFNTYKITDAKGLIYYMAEPRGVGATRCALTQNDLQKQLDADVPMLRLISREQQKGM